MQENPTKDKITSASCTLKFLTQYLKSEFPSYRKLVDRPRVHSLFPTIQKEYLK